MGLLRNLRRRKVKRGKNGGFAPLQPLQPLKRLSSPPRLQGVELERGIFWWVYGLYNGRRIILGPFSSENEAYDEGYTKISSDIDVVGLHTRDEAKASREIRAKVLDETRDVSETFKRFRHDAD